MSSNSASNTALSILAARSKGAMRRGPWRMSPISAKFSFGCHYRQVMLAFRESEACRRPSEEYEEEEK
jgi:hypothetical protein